MKKKYEANRRWAKANPERVKAIKKRWYARNKEKVHAERRAYRDANRQKLDAAKRAWEKANPEMVAMQAARKRLKSMNAKINIGLRHHYDVTLGAYEEILRLQGGVCAICNGRPSTKRSSRLFVDHDHKTGRVRALLCYRCNAGLGYFLESPANFRRAIAYLEGFNVCNEKDWPARVRSVLGRLPEKGSEAGRYEGLAKVIATTGVD